MLIKEINTETKIYPTTTICLTSVTLPLIVVRNLFDASMVVVRVPRQEAWVLLVCHEQADPHHQVHHDEDVVGVGEQVPGNRDTLERKESPERFKGHKTYLLTLRKYMG